MDSSKSGLPEDAAAAIEQAWQAAASNLQLLAMLEVVQDWGRSDVVGVTESATQTETLANFMTTQRVSAGRTEIERIRKTLDAVVPRAERLAQLAADPTRQNSASASMAKALKRLASASEGLRRRFDLFEPDAHEAEHATGGGHGATAA